MSMNDWWIFRGYGDGTQSPLRELPPAPPWRTFSQTQERRGATYQASEEEIEVVNAALRLRRPILITGKPGVGKSSLAYAVAYELDLGDVLYWPITTRTTLNDGLYQYDAIGRLRDANWRWAQWRIHIDAGDLDSIDDHTDDNHGEDTGDKQDKAQDAMSNRTSTLSETAPPDDTDIGRYIRLGPLGTALVPHEKPRVLLIDEIDKSDIDLPSDLLHVFEEGTYEIPELLRLPNELQYAEIGVNTWDSDGKTTIVHGRVQCTNFPFVIFTSNGEREFPPAFKRRCLQLTMRQPSEERLRQIIKAQFVSTLGQQQAAELLEQAKPLIDAFLQRRKKSDLATDQLLNAIHLLTQNVSIIPGKDGETQEEGNSSKLMDAVLRALNE